MPQGLRTIRIAMAHGSGELRTGAEGLQGAGASFLLVQAVGDLARYPEADAVVVDYALAGASDYIRSRPAGDDAPVLALVGREGPCRTVEQSLLMAEADGATIALPKPAGLSDIVMAVSEALDREPGLLPPGRGPGDRRGAYSG